jgi:hypothetical protein
MTILGDWMWQVAEASDVLILAVKPQIGIYPLHYVLCGIYPFHYVLLFNVWILDYLADFEGLFSRRFMFAVEKVATELKPSLSKNHLLISIAAGVTLVNLQVRKSSSLFLSSLNTKKEAPWSYKKLHGT